MRKVFLSSIPMTKVRPYKYNSELYPDSSATGYPITIAIENNVEAQDSVLILSIVTHSEGKLNASEAGYKEFRQQVAELLGNRQAAVEFREIAVSDRANSASHRLLFQELKKYIQEGDEVYADITYGFKSNPIVIFAALNQAYQLMDDVNVQEIIYGNLYNGTAEPEPELFEVTSLFYINSLNGTLGSMPMSLNDKNQMADM